MGTQVTTLLILEEAAPDEWMHHGRRTNPDREDRKLLEEGVSQI